MKHLIERNIIIDDNTYYFNIFRLHQSFLLLISDQKDMGIGSVILGAPPSAEGLKSTIASYNLFGLNQNLLSKIIVEKASYVLKAPVLLLFFLKYEKKENKIAKPLMTFLNGILNEIVEKEKD